MDPCCIYCQPACTRVCTGTGEPCADEYWSYGIGIFTQEKSHNFRHPEPAEGGVEGSRKSSSRDCGRLIRAIYPVSVPRLL